jgi:AcrR family transcriptional regulator
MPPSLREGLIDAAATVLRHEGPAAITTKRIAEVARCSEGSIYNHFRDKQELLACVISERIGGFIALSDQLHSGAGHGDVREQLRRVATAALAFYGDRVDVLTLALQDPDSNREHARAAHEAGFGPWRKVEQLTAWLRAEQELGRARADADPDAAITALLGACFYHALLRHAWVPELVPDDEVIAERAVTAVWLGLAPTDDDQAVASRS